MFERPHTIRARLARWLLEAAGWRLLDLPLPGPRGVVVAYPHTSNWDFIVGLLFKTAMGWDIRFWAKDSLLKIPLFGRWIAWVGAVPVNRSGATGLVQETVAAMNNADQFWLALAPEGTRRHVNGWRMGFFHVWREADVPLGIAVIDYGRKQVGIKAYLPAEDETEVEAFARIERAMGEARGYHPAQAAPIRPYQKAQPPQN